MPLEIKIEGLDKLVGKLDTMAKMRGVAAGVMAGALHIKRHMAKYPPRKHITIKSLGGWASDKQRRWFFWALKKGKIQVPYRRGQSPGSEDLLQKWNAAKPQLSNKGLTASVGIDAKYVQYVQSHKKQSAMMKKIGWQTDKQVIDREGRKVEQLVNREIAKMVK